MESRKIHEVLERMLAIFNCPICLDLMKTPMVTRCAHSFCRHCILSALGTKAKFPCPLCKEEVTKRSLKPQETMDGIVSAVRNIIAAYEMDNNAIFSPIRGPPVQLDISMTPETSNQALRRTQRSKTEDSKVTRRNVRNPRFTRKKTKKSDAIFLDDTTSESSLGSGLKSHLNISSGFPPTRSKMVGRKSKRKTLAKQTEKKSDVGEKKITPKDILDYITQDISAGTEPSPMNVLMETDEIEDTVVTKNEIYASATLAKSELGLIDVLNFSEFGAQPSCSKKPVGHPDGFVPADVKSCVEKVLHSIEQDSPLLRACHDVQTNQIENPLAKAMHFVHEQLKVGLSLLDCQTVAEKAENGLDKSLPDDMHVDGYKSDSSSDSVIIGKNATRKCRNELVSTSATSKSSELNTFAHQTYSKKSQTLAADSNLGQLRKKQISSAEKVQKWMQNLSKDSHEKAGFSSPVSYRNSTQSTAPTFTDSNVVVDDSDDVNDDDTTDEIVIHACFNNESESDDLDNEAEDDMELVVEEKVSSEIKDETNHVWPGIVNTNTRDVDQPDVIMIDDEPSQSEATSPKPVMARKRKIFKSRPSDEQDAKHDKGCNAIKSIYSCVESQEENDPYAFQMSQRTPKAKGKKSQSRALVKERKNKKGVKGKKISATIEDEHVTKRSRSKGKKAAEKRISSLSEARRSKSKEGQNKSNAVVQVGGNKKGKMHFDFGFDSDDENDQNIEVDNGIGEMFSSPPTKQEEKMSVSKDAAEYESQDILPIMGKPESPWAAVQPEVKQYSRKSRSRTRGRQKLVSKKPGEEAESDHAGQDAEIEGDTENCSKDIDEPVLEVKTLAEKISDAESFELDCMTFSQQIRDAADVQSSLVAEKEKRLNRLEKTEREKVRQSKLDKQKKQKELEYGCDSLDVESSMPLVKLGTKSPIYGQLPTSRTESKRSMDLNNESQFKIPLPKVKKSSTTPNRSSDKELLKKGNVTDDNKNMINANAINGAQNLGRSGKTKYDDSSNIESVELSSPKDYVPSSVVEGDVDVIAETPLIAMPGFSKMASPDRSSGPKGESVEFTPTDIENEQLGYRSCTQVIPETPLGPDLHIIDSSAASTTRRRGRSLSTLKSMKADEEKLVSPTRRKSRRTKSISKMLKKPRSPESKPAEVPSKCVDSECVAQSPTSRDIVESSFPINQPQDQVEMETNIDELNSPVGKSRSNSLIAKSSFEQNVSSVLNGKDVSGEERCNITVVADSNESKRMQDLNNVCEASGLVRPKLQTRNKLICESNEIGEIVTSVTCDQGKSDVEEDNILSELSGCRSSGIQVGSVQVVEETQLSLGKDSTGSTCNILTCSRDMEGKRRLSGKHNSGMNSVVANTMLTEEIMSVKTCTELPKASVSIDSGSETEKESETESIGLPVSLTEYEKCDLTIQETSVRAVLQGLNDKKSLSGTIETEESLSLLQPKQINANHACSPEVALDLDSTLDEDVSKRKHRSSDSDDEVVFRKPKRKTFSLDASPLKLNKKSCRNVNEPNSLYQIGQSLGECLREINKEVNDGANYTNQHEMNSNVHRETIEDTEPSHISDSEIDAKNGFGQRDIIEDSVTSGLRSREAIEAKDQSTSSRPSSGCQSVSSSRSQTGTSDTNTTGEIVPTTPSASYYTTQPIILDALLKSEPDSKPLANRSKGEKKSRLSRRSKSGERGKKPEGHHGDEARSSTNDVVSGISSLNGPKALQEVKKNCEKDKQSKLLSSSMHDLDSDLKTEFENKQSYTQFIKEVNVVKEGQQQVTSTEVGGMEDTKGIDLKLQEEEVHEHDDEEPVSNNVATPYFAGNDSESDDDLDLLPSLPAAGGQSLISQDGVENDEACIEKVSHVDELCGGMMDTGANHVDSQQNKTQNVSLKSVTRIPDLAGYDAIEVGKGMKDTDAGDDCADEALDSQEPDCGSKVSQGRSGKKEPDLSGAEDSGHENSSDESSNGEVIPKTPLLPSRSLQRRRGLKSVNSSISGEMNKTRSKGESSQCNINHGSEVTPSAALNFKQGTLKLDKLSTSRTEQTTLNDKLTSAKEQPMKQTDQKAATGVQGETEKDYSYLNTDEALAKVYQNFYNTTTGTPLKCIKDEPVESFEDDCKLVKVEDVPSSAEDEDRLTADDVPSTVDSDNETLPDGASTQGSNWTMNRTSSCEILPTQVREQLEAEVAEIQAQMKAKRALMKDLSSERLYNEDPLAAQSDAESDDDLFDGPTPPPSPPSPASSRNAVSLNPTLVEDLQVLNKYRSRKTPDKGKKKRKTPVKKTPSSVSSTLDEDLDVLDKYRTKRTPRKKREKKPRHKSSTEIPSKRVFRADDSDEDSDNVKVIQETPHKKTRRRIRHMSDSSSDDDFESFIQKEKESQRLCADSQSWEAYGLGKQDDHSQSLPTQNSELCNVNQNLISGGNTNSRSKGKGLKLPKEYSDNTEVLGKKKRIATEIQSSGTLDEAEDMEKSDFQKPVSSVSQSSRRLSVLGSPCVIPDSVENQINDKGTGSVCINLGDGDSGVCKTTLAESVSSSAETEEPSEYAEHLRRVSDVFGRVQAENSKVSVQDLNDSPSVEVISQRKSVNMCNAGRVSDTGTRGPGGKLYHGVDSDSGSTQKDISSGLSRKKSAGGLKRKSCEDECTNDIQMFDADIPGEDENQSDISIVGISGHLPKKMKQTTLDMSPVVYKSYDSSSEHLMTAVSSVQKAVRDLKNRSESPLADVDDVASKYQNRLSSEGGVCPKQSPLQGLNKMRPGRDCSPLARTDSRNNSSLLAREDCMESGNDKESPKPRLFNQCKLQSPLVEVKTKEAFEKLSPKPVNSPLPLFGSSVSAEMIQKLSPKPMAVKQILPLPHSRSSVSPGAVQKLSPKPMAVKQILPLPHSRSSVSPGAVQKLSPKPMAVKQNLPLPHSRSSVSPGAVQKLSPKPMAVKQNLPLPHRSSVSPGAVQKLSPKPMVVKQNLQSPSARSTASPDCLTPKSLKQSQCHPMDKENKKRKVESRTGFDEVDGPKTCGAVPAVQRHESPSQVVQMRSEKVIEIERHNLLSPAVSSPLAGRTPLPMRRGRFLIVSGFNQSMKDVMSEFIESFGFSYSSKFSEKTTHVVVQTVNDQPCMCERTLKYFLGIAGRCWVLSLNWMIESVQQGVCLPEDDYEIHGDTVNGPNHNGPYKARNAVRLLLGRFEVYCHGHFSGMPIAETKSMITMLGARLVNHPKEFTTDNPRCFIIAEPDKKLKEQNYYDRLKKHFSAEVVSREWLLDCVAQYKIQSPKDYSLCSTVKKEAK